jgi:hypothetical protein
MAERNESVALAFEEFVLELHPMQSKAVQEALHHIHEHEHKECNRCEHEKAQDHLQESH